MTEVFLLALVGGVLAQALFKRLLVSISLPFLSYVGWSTYQEFFVPHKGGGASFWPLDIIFAGPVAAAGGAIGAYIVIKLLQSQKR